ILAFRTRPLFRRDRLLDGMEAHASLLVDGGIGGGFGRVRDVAPGLERGGAKRCERTSVLTAVAPERIYPRHRLTPAHAPHVPRRGTLRARPSRHGEPLSTDSRRERVRCRRLWTGDGGYHPGRGGGRGPTRMDAQVLR